MTYTPTAPHLGDSELLHLVDRDASTFELDHWAKHVLACRDCSERLEALQRRTAALSRLLSEVQLPEGFAYPTLPPVRRSPARGRAARMHWLRAAAAVLVIATPLLLVQPLRAWVADHLSAGWSRVAALIAGEEAGGGPPSATPESSSRVWFVPVGPDFVVDIASAQPAGQLILRTAAGEEGALEILGGTGETPVLIEGGVRILNTPRSGASYELVLPGSVARVRVRLAGESVAVLSPEEIREGARVELGGGTRR